MRQIDGPRGECLVDQINPFAETLARINDQSLLACSDDPGVCPLESELVDIMLGSAHKPYQCFKNHLSRILTQNPYHTWT